MQIVFGRLATKIIFLLGQGRSNLICSSLKSFTVDLNGKMVLTFPNGHQTDNSDWYYTDLSLFFYFLSQEKITVKLARLGWHFSINTPSSKKGIRKPTLLVKLSESWAYFFSLLKPEVSENSRSREFVLDSGNSRRESASFFLARPREMILKSLSRLETWE